MGFIKVRGAAYTREFSAACYSGITHHSLQAMNAQGYILMNHVRRARDSVAHVYLS